MIIVEGTIQIGFIKYKAILAGGTLYLKNGKQFKTMADHGMTMCVWSKCECRLVDEMSLLNTLNRMIREDSDE